MVFKILIPFILLSFGISAQQNSVLNGMATDGHRNRVFGVNVIMKGTVTGTITDICGRFSIPVDSEEFTLVFHGMSYDDMRTYEIRLRKSDVVNDTLVFQLGYWKVKNADCKKVDKRAKRYVIE